MSDLLPLSQVFMRHSRAPVPAELLTAAGLELHLQAACERSHAAWPAVTLAAPTFIAHLASRLVVAADSAGASASEIVQALGRLNTSDLYLACACLQGDPAAVAILSHDYLGQVAHLISRMRLAREEVEDIHQSLGERLFVGGADGRPRLAEYGGQGALLSWIRIAAIRSALDRRRGHQAIDTDPQRLAEVVADGRDVQKEYLQLRYRQHFEDALKAALSRLSAEQRTILRLHFIDGLSIDKLGALFKIHRATAARWIAAARRTLHLDVRARLTERLALTTSEVDSLGRLVRSQLHFSLHRYLVTHSGDKAT